MRTARDSFGAGLSAPGFGKLYFIAVILQLHLPDICTDHGATRKRREFTVGDVVTRDVKVTIMQLRILGIVELAKCAGLIGVQGRNCAIEHCSRFLGRAELLGVNNTK